MKKKIIAGICAAIMILGTGLTASAQEVIEGEEASAAAASEKSELEQKIEELEANGWDYELTDTGKDYSLEWREGCFTDDGWGYIKVKSSEIAENYDFYDDIFGTDSYIYLPPSKDGDVVAVGYYEGNEKNVSIPEQIEGLPVKYIANIPIYSRDYTYDGFSGSGGSGGGYFGADSEVSIFVPDSISYFPGIYKNYGYPTNAMGYERNVTFVCNPGSAAEKFFIENNVKYELYKEAPDNSDTGNSDVSSDTFSETTANSSSETSSEETLNSVSTAGTSSGAQAKKTSAASSTNPDTGAAASLTAAAVLGAGVMISRKKK